VGLPKLDTLKVLLFANIHFLVEKHQLQQEPEKPSEKVPESDPIAIRVLQGRQVFASK